MLESAPTPVRKAVSLSYGAFAAVLLLTLVIGLLSGSIFGGLAVTLRAAHLGVRAAEPGGQAAAAARAWLGITYIPITPAVATSNKLTVTTGALIVAVTGNGPAAKAGLREDDVVTAVEQRTIDENTSITDVIKDKKPGDHVQMTILRDGNQQTIDITLGRLPAGLIGPRSSNPFDGVGRDVTRIVSGQ